MAWITYGTSETRPTPLLAKRFFAPAGELAGDMRQTPSRLGLGRTAGAIPGGMAVLEGLVAAIEVGPRLPVMLGLSSRLRRCLT